MSAPTDDVDAPRDSSPARRVLSAILGSGGSFEIESGGDPPSATSGDIGSGVFDVELRRIDAVARGDAPGTAPPLDIGAARWGLAQLAWLAQCLVNERDRSAWLDEVTRRVLADDAPDPGSAEQVWSVDLTLRYLKDLRPQVRAFAADDPARRHYERLIELWPLSCPVQDRGGDVEWDHPTLACLAADRGRADRGETTP